MKSFLSTSLLALLLGCSRSETPAAPPAPPAPVSELRISGPFTHEHLSVYVVETPSTRAAAEMITLAEGLSAGTVKVSEKKQAEVSELLIENASDKACFVQAGDVVKGGQQDRAISRDFVIPARTPPSPVSSFCVEQSRWSGDGKFVASTQNGSGNALKCAVQKENSQQKVWAEVRGNKERLTDNLALGAPQSTSLNEELEKGKTQERMKAFRDALSGAVKDRPQAVGLIVALNGKLNNADLYDDPGLFKKLHSRLLDSAILDALSLKADTAAKAPPADEARTFLAQAEKGEEKTERIRDGLEACTVENGKTVQFDYRWEKRRLHRQALAK